MSVHLLAFSQYINPRILESQAQLLFQAFVLHGPKMIIVHGYPDMIWPLLRLALASAHFSLSLRRNDFVRMSVDRLPVTITPSRIPDLLHRIGAKHHDSFGEEMKFLQGELQ